MKTAKTSMKPHKSPSMGKGPPLKKTGHSRSPYRVMGSSRPKHLPSMKPLQKRPPSPPVRMRHMSVSPPRRSQRSSSQGSPVSMDRLRSVKRSKFEKQKPPHSMASSSRAEFGRLSPYAEKYSRSTPPHPPPPFASSVKKMHREEECYSPPRPLPRMEGGSRSPLPMMSRHRREDYEVAHPRPRSSSSVATKETPAKRYREESPGDRYTSGVEKPYPAPTLHERFSGCADAGRSEPRLRYSAQDLEKITIDIHRGPREDRSPTLRRILDPTEVKLVRRAGEGRRPIFDREEIRRAPRDLREDARWEQHTSYGGHPAGDLREVENYEITRHRFEPPRSGGTAPQGSSRSLSDRWQEASSSGMDREDREAEYSRGPPSRSFGPRSEVGAMSDPDYRSDRYMAEGAPRQRHSYQTPRHRLQERDVIPVLRKDGIGSREMRHRKEGPPLDDGKSHYTPEKRYGPKERRGESPKWHSPEYPRRSDKYPHRAPWEEKQEHPPHRGYYDHEGRDGMDSYRGRGSGRTFRSPRGFRSRGGYRPPMRGGDSRYRGPSSRSFRGGSSGLRGRSSSRRGRYSPSMWEHDLYSRTPERKMGP